MSDSGARLERFENRAAARAKRTATLGRFGERARLSGYSERVYVNRSYHIGPFNIQLLSLLLIICVRVEAARACPF